jgi:hypothetical protein
MIERPENVRIQRVDGTVIPCELTYSGKDDDGASRWSVATEIHTEGDKLLVGWWPNNCNIEIPSDTVPSFIEDGVL